MFAPDGYVMYEAICTNIGHLAESVLVRITGASLKDKHKRENIGDMMLNAGIIADRSNAQFIREFVEEILLAKLISYYPPLLCSPTGTVMQVNEDFFLHGDRLDWFYLSLPIDRMSELSRYIEFSKVNRFDGASIRRRYCFIDAEKGLVKIKNNSAQLFDYCSHYWNDQGTEMVSLVEKFSGWAVCWRESDLPTPLDLVNLVFLNDESHWDWEEFFREDEDQEAVSGGLKDSLAYAPKGPGRPALVPDVARILSIEYGNQRGDLSWKALTQQVSLRLGKTVAVKTVQRAMRLNCGQVDVLDLGDAT